MFMTWQLKLISQTSVPHIVVVGEKIEHFEMRDRKKSRRSFEIKAYLFLHWVQLVNNVQIKSDFTTSSREKNIGATLVR